MKRENNISIGLTIMLCVIGTQAVAAESVTESSQLSPMPKPEQYIGDSVTEKGSKGKVSVRTIIAIDKNTITWQYPNGCTIKYPHEEFSQMVERKNCGRADFTTALKLIKGEIWPLTVGKKWQYRYSGGDKSGSKWKGKMRCKAKKQVRVDVPAGSFETYHIVCDTKNYRRQYYVSPELGISVKFKFKKRGGDRFESELVEYTRGGSD